MKFTRVRECEALRPDEIGWVQKNGPNISNIIGLDLDSLSGNRLVQGLNVLTEQRGLGEGSVHPIRPIFTHYRKNMSWKAESIRGSR